MSRYIEVAHRPFSVAVVSAALAERADGQPTLIQDNRPPIFVVPRVNSHEMMTFVVKLRNATTRIWGDQIEVRALSAADAAEQLAGEQLVEGRGERANLRVSVWATPFGSRPCRYFYVPALG